MIAVFDVGNSEITAGIFDGEELISHWRLTTAAQRTADELAILIRSITGTAFGSPVSASGSAICSVVPAVTPMLAEACEMCFDATPVMIDARSKLPVKLDVEEPFTVGADRVANTLAASRLYRRDCIVVDMGTATTFDCITADGAFLGGAIMPGIMIAADTLFRRTAQLPATEIYPPKTVIARRTDECIRAGVLFGAVDSIDGMVRRVKNEWPHKDPPLVIATGGMAEAVQPHSSQLELVDPTLTLKGIRIGYELLTA
ncbi:MAG TPA: type III pantothenate kinase [Gemmatimonadaceae bacterium]|nr:type III pantothenate kinase [Gemmatimonadaceae bacterium]